MNFVAEYFENKKNPILLRPGSIARLVLCVGVGSMT